MDNSSLSHTTWTCKYHIVFAPKYRRKIIYKTIRQDIIHILTELCKRKGIEKCNGKWMLFVDGDDYLDSKCVEELVNKAEENEADIVICDYFVENKSSIVKESFFNESVTNLLDIDSLDLLLFDIKKPLCR